MCRADVSPDAEVFLARVIDDMAHAIAEIEGVDRRRINIGPVDFGPDHNELEQQ